MLVSREVTCRKVLWKLKYGGRWHGSRAYEIKEKWASWEPFMVIQVGGLH